MRDHHKRFEDAMHQLDDAFNKASEDENKSKERAKEPPVDKKTITSSQKSAFKNTPRQEPFVDSLEKGLSRLEQRKKTQNFPKKSEETPKEVTKSIDLEKNDSKIESLIKKIAENKVEQVILEALEKKLQETESSKQNLEKKFFEAQGVKKNRNILLEKFSQYSNLKLNFFVSLGTSKIKMKNLFSLVEGDIIPITQWKNEESIFYINQKPLGSGKIIISNESRGFQIDSFNQDLK